MRTYKVMIQGKGVRLLVDNVMSLYGFNSSRFVTAEEEEEAGHLACAEALELLRDRIHKIDGVRDQHAITVVTVSTYERALPKVKPGFVWFREEAL